MQQQLNMTIILIYQHHIFGKSCAKMISTFHFFIISASTGLYICSPAGLMRVMHCLHSPDLLGGGESGGAVGGVSPRQSGSSYSVHTFISFHAILLISSPP